MIDRRNFLRSLLAVPVLAHTLDIEKLLWVPGKLISIPAPMTPYPPGSAAELAWLIEEACKAIDRANRFCGKPRVYFNTEQAAASFASFGESFPFIKTETVPMGEARKH